MISPPRRTAYEVTLRVDTGRSDLARALADLRDALESARDRGLATDIATGTQRWRGQIDYLLAAAYGRPLARLDPEVLAILRISAYQLRHLTRVPASAVVNDAVALTKAVRKRSAAGLVNAVLRKVASAPAELPGPPTAPAGTPEWRRQAVSCLSVTHSHPAWLVERWLDRYGWDAALTWVAYNNSTPSMTVWPAPGRRRDSWPPHRDTTWVPGGCVLDTAADGMPLLRDGTAFAQDEASAVVGAVAAAAATATGASPVLDACAAPGGKTLALDGALPATTRLLASDIRDGRVATLREMLRRYGRRPVPVLRADAEALPFAGSMGAVLLDAPCSGLGTLRRDPDVRWRRTPADLEQLAARQRAMLVEALRAVRPGGLVAYATCSSEPEENEFLVSEVAVTTGWRILPASSLRLPGRVADLVAPEGWVRTLPHRHQLDAFFVALLGSGLDFDASGVRSRLAIRAEPAPNPSREDG